jgi:hypothetical protein
MRVGLAPTQPPLVGAELAAARAACAPRAACRGQQRYVAASNTCADPSCGDFYFQQLDALSRTCVHSPSLVSIAAAMLGALALGELALQHRQQSESARAIASCEREPR